LKEVRNLDGKLVCRINKKRKIIEIKIKNCLTQIELLSDGSANVINTKN